jgi:hypothetical protein
VDLIAPWINKEDAPNCFNNWQASLNESPADKEKSELTGIPNKTGCSRGFLLRNIWREEQTPPQSLNRVILLNAVPCGLVQAFLIPNSSDSVQPTLSILITPQYSKKGLAQTALGMILNEVFKLNYENAIYYRGKHNAEQDQQRKQYLITKSYYYKSNLFTGLQSLRLVEQIH